VRGRKKEVRGRGRVRVVLVCGLVRAGTQGFKNSKSATLLA
jgi:hypothetical protein